jgi:hypothetical protein
MTFFDFNALVNNVTRKGKNAYRGVSFLYLGQAGKNLDPFQKEGWYDPGKPVSIPNLEKSPESEDVEAGFPMGHIIGLPKSDKRTLDFKLSMPRLFAQELAMLGGVAFKINYSTTGQTTVQASPAPTKTSVTVATGDGAEFKENDLVIVDTKHSTLGGWNSDVIVTSVDGDRVSFDPPLPIIPATNANFKKVAGRVTGTDKDTAGMSIVDSLIPCFERVQLLMVTHEVGSRSIFAYHVTEAEIVKGGTLSQSESDVLKTLSLSFKPVLQESVVTRLRDGSDETRPSYGKYYILPFESA